MLREFKPSRKMAGLSEEEKEQEKQRCKDFSRLKVSEPLAFEVRTSVDKIIGDLNLPPKVCGRRRSKTKPIKYFSTIKSLNIT